MDTNTFVVKRNFNSPKQSRPFNCMDIIQNLCIIWNAYTDGWWGVGEAGWGWLFFPRRRRV
jgi:hypothetical protein